MAYEKTNWQNGTTALSAANLNHMEEGIFNLSNLFDESIGYKVKFGDVLITPTTAISDTSHYKYSGSATIDIGLDWTSTPLVYVTVRTSAPRLCAVSAEGYNSSTGKAIIRLDRTTSQSTGVNWIAIGK